MVRGFAMFQQTQQEREKEKQLYSAPQRDPQKDLPLQGQADPRDIIAKAERQVVGAHIRTTDTKIDPGSTIRTTTTPGATAARIAETAGSLAEERVDQQIREGLLPAKLRETTLEGIKQEIDRLAHGVAEKQEREQQEQQEQERKQKKEADPHSSLEGKALFVDSRPPTQRGLTTLADALKDAAKSDPNKEQISLAA
jgi:hypothetical protein